MSEAAALLCTIAGGVATLSLNRPQVRNALDQAQRERLTAAFTALNDDPAVSAVILRGEGKNFCAGQDQNESARMDAAGARARIDAYATLYAAIRGLEKPLIARLHGPVAGAGLQLALLCDLRIAAEDTTLGMTELAIGSAAIMGSTLLLPIIGEAAMKRLVMLADFLPAPAALDLGLLTEIHPPGQLDARVTALAATLAARPPDGTRLTKAWWRRMSQPQFDAMVAEAHAAHAENFAKGALTKGAQAFLGRRDTQESLGRS